MFWKDHFSKKIVLEYDLSCIIRKDDFFFSKIWTYSLDRKRKMIFLKKNYMEIWYFLQMFWKNCLSKKIAMEYDLSFVIWKDGIFLSENIFFLWTENERWSFSRNTWKKWYFLYICINVINMILPSFAKKVKDDQLVKKYT